MQTLTAAQREQWSVDGYLHLRGVLSPEQVESYSEALDRVRAEPGYEPSDLPRGHYGWLPHAADLDTEGFMDRRHLLPYGQPFLDLIDHEPVFDLIVDIMGPYLLLSMSQAIVRPSTTTSSVPAPASGSTTFNLLKRKSPSRFRNSPTGPLRVLLIWRRIREQ